MNIGVEYLREGAIVEDPVYIDNTLLVGSGVTLTQPLIDRLKKHRYKLDNGTVRVKFDSVTDDIFQDMGRNFNWDMDDVDSTIDDALKEEISQALKAADQNINMHLSLVQQCASKITNALYTQQMKTNEHTNQKEWSSDLTYNLADYGDSFDVHDHSIRVAQFAVTLASFYNMKKEAEGKFDELINLEEITMAALLHDYGVRYKDELEMLNLSYTAKLSEKLINEYNIDSDLLRNPYQEKYIPIYTFCSLKLSDNSNINQMILFNYENENGTGPLKTIDQTLKASPSVKAGAKIIHLCSLYDNVLTQAVSNGLSGKDMNLENVTAVLDYAAVNGMVNLELKNLFTEIIPLYSIGTRVLLSDGRYARVIDVPKDHVFAARPIVQTIGNNIIDLKEAPLSLTIKSIVPKDKELSMLVNNIASSQIKGKSDDYDDYNNQYYSRIK